jgi:hypothetical protein
MNPHLSQLRSTAPTLRCDTFPLPVLRTKGEGSWRMLGVAPRNAALEQKFKEKGRQLALAPQVAWGG